MIKMLLTRAPDLDRLERERGLPMLEKPVFAKDNHELRVAAEKGRLLLQGAAPGNAAAGRAG
ncbi:MAG: hypothetical protein V3T00_00570 [bacterium]